MIEEPNDPPLVPKSPAGAMAAGGTVTALMAALGWLASEMLDLEKTVTHVGDQITSVQSQHSEQLGDIDEDVDKLEDRMTIMEREMLELTNR
jgi:predicted  nucleic acid-binding Zn-ribbon protein